MTYTTYQFNTNVRRRIYDSSRIVYHVPTPHPTRILSRHDLFYVTKGSISVKLGDLNLHSGKDTVFILPAGILHEGTENCEINTQTLWILMEEEEKDGPSKYDISQNSEESLRLPPCIDASGFPKILEYFEKILITNAEGDKNRASAYMALLLCELHDASLAKERNIHLAEEIRQIINQNLNNKVSNSFVAQKIGFSVKTIESSFKKRFNVTVHKYILCEKLKKGKILIEYFPHMTIRDIAEELNFYDEYHFSRQFKKEYGVSPTEYRKQIFGG